MRKCPNGSFWFCRDRDGEGIFEILRINRQHENVPKPKTTERRKERMYNYTKPPSTTIRVNHEIRRQLILWGLTPIRRRNDEREKKSSEDCVADVVFVVLIVWIPWQQFICESRVVCSDHYRLRKSSAHTSTTQRFLPHQVPLPSPSKHALHVYNAVL